MLQIPKILIPKAQFDYTKWAVNAVDQFTSEPDYWENLDKSVGEYSTLRIVLPELYLSDKAGLSARVDKINATMYRYLSEGVFDEIDDLILVERTNGTGRMRLGIMVAIDLEEYDFLPEARAAIRATEATVQERLPVRVDIRRNAPIELPHAMMLLDDDQDKVIERVYARRDSYPKLYDFELNMGGGHLRGYRITDSEQVLAEIIRISHTKPFNFAVGDGNHSLAAAKKYWDSIKGVASTIGQTSAARYALVELVNLHCEGLLFEPIHRVLIGADESAIDEMSASFSGTSELTLVYNDKSYSISCPDNAIEVYKQMEVFVKEYLSSHSSVEVDYVHGEEHVRKVAANVGGVGIIMPTILKSELFPYVNDVGILPKKAFSMGEAEDKRYYLEAKKIK